MLGGHGVRRSHEAADIDAGDAVFARTFYQSEAGFEARKMIVVGMGVADGNYIRGGLYIGSRASEGLREGVG